MCSHFDQYIPTLNLHRIHRTLSPRRPSLARLRIPFPPMPRTNNLTSRDHALTKRPAAMQTDVIHGANFAVHISNADGLIAAREFFGFVGGGEIGLSGDLYEGHVCSRDVVLNAGSFDLPSPRKRGSGGA